MTRVSETEQQKPAQPRLGEKNATGCRSPLERGWRGIVGRRPSSWPRSSRYWYESGSRQNNWRDTHQSFHGSATGSNKWVWRVKGIGHLRFWSQKEQLAFANIVPSRPAVQNVHLGCTVMSPGPARTTGGTPELSRISDGVEQMGLARERNSLPTLTVLSRGPAWPSALRASAAVRVSAAFARLQGMFTWAIDARSQVSELFEPSCGSRLLAPTQDFPQLGAGTQAPLLGCWAKKTPQVSAAPVSTVAEGSSIGGPGGGIQNSWKPAGSKKHHKGGLGCWQTSSWYGYESGSRQNNWRETRQRLHRSAPGPNKRV
eukprot:s1788_g11.t3